MSKLAFIRRYNYAPAAGGILGDLWNIGKGLFGKKKATVPTAAPAQWGGVGFGAGVGITGYDPTTKAAARRLTGGGGGFRRGKGITARELRGFRKVSNLLHREGMVPKKARKGKSPWQ